MRGVIVFCRSLLSIFRFNLIQIENLFLRSKCLFVLSIFLNQREDIFEPHKPITENPKFESFRFSASQPFRSI